MPDRRKVVVTGLGAVSPLGIGAATLHERWDAGQVAIADAAARGREFEAKDHLSIKEARRLERFAQPAAVAACEELKQAGWAGEAGNPYGPMRVGCILATGIG